MYEAVGTLQYGPGYRVVLNTDQGIVDFYRSLIPKAWTNHPQKYPAHISVVRKEVPPDLRVWSKYEGEAIKFRYSPLIQWSETYYWLDVECERFCEIRMELGLTPYRGWSSKFHMTIANKKKVIVQI